MRESLLTCDMCNLPILVSEEEYVQFNTTIINHHKSIIPCKMNNASFDFHMGCWIHSELKRQITNFTAKMKRNAPARDKSGKDKDKENE